MWTASRKIYRVFLWLYTSAAVTLIYYTFCIYLLDTGLQYLWVIGYIVTASFFLTLFYHSKKLSPVFAIFTAFTASMIVIYAAKFALLFALPPKTFLNLDDVGIAITGVTIFILILGVFLLVNGKFNSLDKIIRMEDSIADKEKFMSFLKEVYAGSKKHMEIERFVGGAGNLGLLFLLVIFVTLLRDPSAKWIYSIAFLLFTVGAIGVYLILYQMKSVLEWKLLGYDVPKSMTARWNKIFVWFFIPIIVIPLLIPWNYQIIQSKTLNSFITEQTSGIQKINFTVQPVIKPQTVTNTNGVYIDDTNAQLTVKEGPDSEQVTGMRTLLPLVYILGGFIGFYLILAIIGGILSAAYRYKKRSPFVEFMIRRYKRVQTILQVFGGLFVLIGRLFLAIFGLHKFRSNISDRELASPVAQQLFALFNIDNELPDEKKDEIKTIIREFVRMIDVLNRYTIPYRFYYGPMEYIDKVINEAPEEEETLRKIVTIFNESRYSLHLLDEAKKTGYMEAVAYVIANIGQNRETQNP